MHRNWMSRRRVYPDNCQHNYLILFAILSNALSYAVFDSYLNTNFDLRESFLQFFSHFHWNMYHHTRKIQFYSNYTWRHLQYSISLAAVTVSTDIGTGSLYLGRGDDTLHRIKYGWNIRLGRWGLLLLQRGLLQCYTVLIGQRSATSTSYRLNVR